MAVISFYTQGKDQTGNTTSAMAYATYLGIEKNKKTLLISTSFNNDEVKTAFWPQKNNKRSGLFGPNTAAMSDNGIEGLDRIIRSNKISPDIITDYTKVALKNRLEILYGYKGEVEQYKMIQTQYSQIVNLASKYYHTVIVDISEDLERKTQLELLNASDIVVALSTQKLQNIENVINSMEEGTTLRKTNTILTLGRYDEDSTYNTKNISRNILRQKNEINSIPYNTLLLEATQEGKIIDFMLKLLNLKGRDENTFFLDEIKRLDEDIEKKILEIQQMMR